MQIDGTITLNDGSTSAFSVSADGWQQWAATTDRLAKTGAALDAIERALQDVDDETEGDEDE